MFDKQLWSIQPAGADVPYRDDGSDPTLSRRLREIGV